MSISRRQFLKNSSTAGGALAIGFSLTACSGSRLPPVAAPGDFQPDAYLRITTQGEIVVQIPKAEMGQGVITGMLTLIGEELDTSPALLRFEHAPAHPQFDDPEFRMQVTGGSASVRVYARLLREVGAAARAAILMAASRDSGIAVEQLSLRDGVVSAKAGGYRSELAPLVPLASQFDIPEQLTLKSPTDYRFVGKYDQRADARSKSDGTAQFGMDVQLDGLRVAVLRRSPAFGGVLTQFDATKALNMTGVEHVFAVGEAVAVVADNYWHAQQGAKAVALTFSEPESAYRSSAELEAAMDSALADPDSFHSARKTGSAASTEDPTVSGDYFVPFLAHAPMEPLNATARVTAERVDVWTGTQAPDVAQAAAADALGISRDRVFIHNQMLGGGFGRRAGPDVVVEAVRVAAQAGVPVKVVWSREDDTQQDMYRPAMKARLAARLSSDGSVENWSHHIVGPSVLQSVASAMGAAAAPAWVPDGVFRFAGKIIGGRDPQSVEGAAELPYQFGGVEVAFRNLPTHVPLGFWRSVGHSYNAFVVESFVDEVAHAAGIDPLQFRLQYLPEDSPERACLMQVAQMADWQAPPSGVVQGIAVHSSFESTVAEVVRLRTVAGELRVDEVFCAVHCGEVINPGIVEAQMQGGIVFALSAALFGQITLDKGAVVQSNFHDYPLLRMDQSPAIHVAIVPGDGPPTGVGEPGVPPLAAALGNALFAATGERQRRLPFSVKA